VICLGFGASLSLIVTPNKICVWNIPSPLRSLGLTGIVNAYVTMESGHDLQATILNRQFATGAPIGGSRL
jgi:hypothetical protein